MILLKITEGIATIYMFYFLIIFSLKLPDQYVYSGHLCI